MRGKYQLLVMISIHAPIRGATDLPPGIQSVLDISIHAPIRGATNCGIDYIVKDSISIHAPIRGATLIQNILILKIIFQSTLL